jgi:RNA methyltransferase, TrmH family
MLTSLQNPLFKEIRKLHQAKGRREKGLFLLEGTNLLETACQVNCSLETVCYTQKWKEENFLTWQKIVKLARRVELVSFQVLNSIATTVTPDGVIATVSRESHLTEVPTQLQRGLVLEDLQDPGNLGTIMRTAVATGVDCLYLSHNSVEVDHPKVLRASVGAWFYLACQQTDDLEGVIKFHQAQGIQIIATLPNTEKLYWEVDFTLPSLILLGNEGAGLSEKLIQLADQKVKLPLRAGVESLNVAIATSAILYEMERQNHFFKSS